MEFDWCGGFDGLVHEEPNWVGHRDGHLGGLVSPLGQCPNPSVVWGAGGHPLGPPWVHALAPGP